MGARSTLRPLPVNLLFYILHFLEWSALQFYHDQRSGGIAEAVASLLRERERAALTPEPPAARPADAELQQSESLGSDDAAAACANANSGHAAGGLALEAEDSDEDELAIDCVGGVRCACGTPSGGAAHGEGGIASTSPGGRCRS